MNKVHENLSIHGVARTMGEEIADQIRQQQMFTGLKYRLRVMDNTQFAAWHENLGPKQDRKTFFVIESQ